MKFSSLRILDYGLGLGFSVLSFSKSIIQTRSFNNSIDKSSLLHFKETSRCITFSLHSEKTCCFFFLLKCNTLLTQCHCNLVNHGNFLCPENEIFHIDNTDDIRSNKQARIKLLETLEKHLFHLESRFLAKSEKRPILPV